MIDDEDRVYIDPAKGKVALRGKFILKEGAKKHFSDKRELAEKSLKFNEILLWGNKFENAVQPEEDREDSDRNYEK